MLSVGVHYIIRDMEDYINNDQNIIAELAVKKTKSKSDDEGHLTIDVFQSEDEIVIQSTIAGADPDNIDVSVTKDVVTIKGFREPPQKIKPSDYLHRELYWGHFSRAVVLPVDIDSDRGAKATFKNGVLTITLRKL